MGEVLVTDGLWRKSLSVVRALGVDGIKVGVAGDSYFTTSFFSRYCSKKVIIPNAANDEKGFLKGFINELENEKYDVVFPMEDSTIEALISKRKDVESLVRLPLPSSHSLNIAWDKSKTLLMAQRLGIPIPKTFIPKSNKDIRKIADKVSYPVVIKPKTASGSKGLRYVDTKLDLVETYNKLVKDFDGLIIQERIPREGRGIGASFLFDWNSKPLAGFTYQRLREYPVNGGPSTLRESTNNSELMEMGMEILKKLKWVGVAMVEFKMDPRDKKAKLMEINPRFWGSLELSIVSGVNFPVLIYKMAMGEKFKPVFKYRVGVRCRWLIPGDVLHFVSNPDRFDMDPSFFDFWADNTHYDQLKRDDIKGTLGTILCTGVHTLNPNMWRYARKR